MSDDVFQSLSGVVPRALTKPGSRKQASPRGERGDHPLGRRGVHLLAGVPLFSGLARHLAVVARRLRNAEGSVTS